MFLDFLHCVGLASQQICDNIPNGLWFSISSSNVWVSGISETNGAGGRNQSNDFPLSGELHKI